MRERGFTERKSIRSHSLSAVISLLLGLGIGYSFTYPLVHQTSQRVFAAHAAPQNAIAVQKGTKFVIVTPTYPPHFDQNVRFLMSIVKNGIDYNDVQILFVTTFDEDAPALYKVLSEHEELTARVSICLRPTEKIHAVPSKLRVDILPLRHAYEEMKLPAEETMKRTWNNKRWYGKYTHLSVKKYAGAWYAFERLQVDVVWWLDSEAYLWKRTQVLRMLEEEWKRPRLYWSSESHFKRNSEVHIFHPQNGSLPVNDMFTGKRPHLFSSSFYLIGKELFREWTEYINTSWEGRSFLDVFLAVGQRESGYIMHIIESQLIAYIGGCQSSASMSDACRKYQLIEINGALQSLIRPQSKLKSYLEDMKFQGQFEHMFRLYEDPRYHDDIQKVAQFYDLPSFRADKYYTNCSLLKTILNDMRSGNLPMFFQTNSDGCVKKLISEDQCGPTLPITCGIGVWNETCTLDP